MIRTKREMNTPSKLSQRILIEKKFVQNNPYLNWCQFTLDNNFLIACKINYYYMLHPDIHSYLSKLIFLRKRFN